MSTLYKLKSNDSSILKLTESDRNIPCADPMTQVECTMLNIIHQYYYIGNSVNGIKDLPWYNESLARSESKTECHNNDLSFLPDIKTSVDEILLVEQDLN